MKKIQSIIEKKLTLAMTPEYLQVINESKNHNVPPNSETHFRVVLVSKNFEGIRQVKRHQQIYSVLQKELQSGVHALALKTYTPQEWEDSQHEIGQSPQCLGGGHS